MVVQHNMPAMTANRYYTTNNSSLSKSLEKLSSGYAINRAGDNAAGLAVSEKMRAQIAGLTQASKNAEDGISMVQTYEGALQETDSILQRMRTIAVQSANGSYQNDVDRDALQLEFDQLNDELNQIADTDFNGVVVLNGGVMADGTVANDTSKVAQRPEVAEVDSKSSAVFTYNSSVNGTVDSAGNGKLSVNGVSMTLKAGKGETTLGSTATGGVTSYKTGDDITVSNGKASGTVEVNEVYKVDDSTTKIEIHGESFSIGKTDSTASGWGVFYDSGDKAGTLATIKDGLAIRVEGDSNGPTAVTLSGKYEVDENRVTTSKSFVSGATNGVASPGDVTNVYDADGITGKKGNASISGRDLTFDDESATGDIKATGKLTVNGADIDVGPDALNKGKIGSATYEVTAFSVDGDTVTGTVEASGSVTATTETSLAVAADSTKDVTLGGTGSGTAKAYTLTTGEGTSTTAYVAVSSGTSYLYIGNGAPSSEDAPDFTDATSWKSLASDATVYLNKSGTMNAGAAGSEDVIKLTIKAGTAAGTLDTTSGQKGEVTKYSDKALGGVTAYKSFSSTGNLVLTGSTANSVPNTDGTKYSLANGLTIDNTGALNGKFEINDKLENLQTVGTFKVSQGVSTSDSFNHGTANLTFADNMTLQVGARSKDAVTFNFSYTTNGIGNLRSDLNASARGLGTDQLKVSTQEDANAAIDAIDNAINKVSMIRGTFGAIQNRLEHKISNINTNAENLTAAESRIRDTQMDQEMMKFTSAQILSQASQSMLAQANSLPQGVLQLLG